MKDLKLQFGLLRMRLFGDPENPEIYSHLLLLSELQGDYTIACALYRELLDSNPYAHLAWFHLGLCCRQTGHQADALEALEYAFLANPDFDEGYFAYTELALSTGAAASALAYLTEHAKRKTQADTRLLRHIAECHLHLNDAAAAENCLQQCVQLDPANADAHYTLGVCYAAAQNYPAAARCFRQALRTENRREDFHLALADVYARLGKKRMATQHFRQAIDLAPDEPPAWLAFAAYLLHTGRPAEALEVVDEARDYTFGAQLDYCSAACLFLLGRRPEALQLLRSAHTADPSNLEVFFRWAPALSSDADIRQAIEEK